MPDTSETRSINATVALLLRHLPLVLLAAVGGAGVAYLAGPSTGAEAKAEAVVGLGDQVNFTFWGQVRDTYAARAADDGLIDEILADDPGLRTLAAVPFDSDSTRIIIEATADDAESAVAGASRLTDMLVELSVAERRAEFEEERALLTADLEAVDAQISDLTDDVAEAAAAEAAARLVADQRLDTYEQDITALRVAEQERDSLRNRLSVLNREAGELEGDIREVDRDAALAEGRITHVSAARSVLVDTESRATVTVLGGLVGAVLAALAVTTFLGHRQRVSRSLLDDRFRAIPVTDASGRQPVGPVGEPLWLRLVDESDRVGVLRTPTVSGTPDWLTNPALDAEVGTSQAAVLMAEADQIVLLCSNRDQLHLVDELAHSIATTGAGLALIVVEES